MDIRKLQRAIVDGLEDVKAQNIVVFNTEKLSPLFERVIIASGTSNRQTKALASSVRETVKKRGLPVMATEGEDNGEWIIVDCGAAVAHIMQPAIRDYYHLEELWGGKPVRLKVVEATGPAGAKRPDGADRSGAGRAQVTAEATAGRSAKKTATRAPAKAAPKTRPTKSSTATGRRTARATAKPASAGRAAKPATGAKRTALPAKTKSGAKSPAATSARPSTARPRAASTPVVPSTKRRTQTKSAPRKPGRG